MQTGLLAEKRIISACRSERDVTLQPSLQGTTVILDDLPFIKEQWLVEW